MKKVVNLNEWIETRSTQSEAQSNEAIDINDPVLLRMRAAMAKRNKKVAEMPTSPTLSPAKEAKLKKLMSERDQLMRDMEQEAEIEGGPIADQYGKKLNKIDKEIAKLGGHGEWGPEDHAYMSKAEIERRARSIRESVEPLCEATVEMDAMDPDNKEFLKFLKKNRVKIISKEMQGPGGGTPVITMQGSRKDLENVLADDEYGWDDADLAEYIEESVEVEEAKMPEPRKDEYYFSVRNSDAKDVWKMADDEFGNDIDRGRIEVLFQKNKYVIKDFELAKRFYQYLRDRGVKFFDQNFVSESVEVNEARSINKIQKDYSRVTSEMAEVVLNWKAAKESGDKKAEDNFLQRLKDLTAQKKGLEKELEQAVMGKDKDAELVGAFESMNEGSMGEIDIMAKTAKNFKSFKKEVMADFKLEDSPEFEAWLKSLYAPYEK